MQSAQRGTSGTKANRCGALDSKTCPARPDRCGPGGHVFLGGGWGRSIDEPTPPAGGPWPLVRFCTRPNERSALSYYSVVWVSQGLLLLSRLSRLLPVELGTAVPEPDGEPEELP